MKYSPYDWTVFDGKIKNGPQGRLWMRTAKPVAVYIEQGGYEVLLGFGSEFDVRISGSYDVRTDPPILGSVYDRSSEVLTAAGDDPFTNMDRMPLDAGHFGAVAQAGRQAQLQLASLIRNLKAETAALRAERAAVRGEPPSEPVSDVNPAEPDAQRD